MPNTSRLLRQITTKAFVHLLGESLTVMSPGEWLLAALTKVGCTFAVQKTARSMKVAFTS